MIVFSEHYNHSIFYDTLKISYVNIVFIGLEIKSCETKVCSSYGSLQEDNTCRCDDGYTGLFCENGNVFTFLLLVCFKSLTFLEYKYCYYYYYYLSDIGEGKMYF